MADGDEEALIEALSKVLLKDDDDSGMDEDLVAYIAGMLASHVVEHTNPNEAITEVLLPFLESVSAPDDRIAQAQTAVSQVLHRHDAIVDDNDQNKRTTTRKLTQGVVSMASNLDESTDEETRYLWGKESGVKANANPDLIDAHQDKQSAKEKRKALKKEAEHVKKAYAQAAVLADQDEFTLVRMNAAAWTTQAVDKKKDVQVRNVTISLDSGTVLLEAGELKFNSQRRYGLIGENGVGKSTLLKAISMPEGIEGFPQHLRVLHVRQEVPRFLEAGLTVMQAVLQSDVERNTLLQQYQTIQAKLEAAGATNNNNNNTNREAATADGMQELAADLKMLEDVTARLGHLKSDAAEARAAMILSGLQFTPEKQHATIESLSGGWRMRVALAAALFVEPDICLLDEPTNHLDLEAVLWLESYLVDYRNTLVVVSHDRGFLNEVCTDIIEFKHKKLTYYRGNFDTYIKLRDENIRNSMRVYQAYQSKREHMMEFIEKFRANAKRSTMVQSRIKAVEKMDAEAPEPIVVDQIWRFAIPSSEPVSRPIISVNDVSFDYTTVTPEGAKIPEDDFLLQKVNFGVDLTSRIVLLGANGQGKTTLLNLIMGRLQPVKGSVVINSSLRIGHFTQHSSDNFDLSLSAVENLLRKFKDAEDQEIRSFLGRFQIQGSDALKPMMLLSGGQKSRVAFATLAYSRPHVLVIDEGSNHLSMEAVDALIEAIQDFQGGIMVVSHDQYFVSKTCNEIWVVHGGLVTRFRGDFDEYKKHTAEITQQRVEESVKKVAALQNAA